jgi:hypothetical protein
VARRQAYDQVAMQDGAAVGQDQEAAIGRLRKLGKRTLDLAAVPKSDRCQSDANAGAAASMDCVCWPV